MRCLMTLILITALSVPLRNQPPQQRLHIMEDQFAAKYPQWNVFDQQTKMELFNMFDRSSNKHLWFPGYYPEPVRKSYTYTPTRLYNEEYIKKGGT